MAFLEVALETFTSWLWLFGAPARDPNILWVIVPVWVTWFFTEFFQEKRGTGFGNAITNGGIALWVAVDWGRHLTDGLSRGNVATDYSLYVKFGLSGLLLLYGLVIIVKGLKRKKFASIAGRVRVQTYLVVMFSPVVYDIAEINLMNIVSIFVFFPIFYFLLEIIDRIIPDSKALTQDTKGSPQPSSDTFSSQSSMDPFSNSSSTATPPIGDQAPRSSQSPQHPDAENPFASHTSQNDATMNPIPQGGKVPGGVQNPSMNQPGPTGPGQNSNYNPNPFPGQQPGHMMQGSRNDLQRRNQNSNPNPNPNPNQVLNQNPNQNTQGNPLGNNMSSNGNPFDSSAGDQASQFQEPDFDKLPEKDRFRLNR